MFRLSAPGDRTARSSVRPLVIVLVAAAALASACRVPAPPKDLNVLLVTIDTLRPDRLSCYGSKYLQTPKIDRLAARGVLFERAFAHAPLTLPSHDAQAFSLVRRNFDNAEYRDPWWVKGYEATTLVVLGCTEPCSTCFCTSVGGGPFSEKHLDVLLSGLGDHFAARAMTEKGEALLRKAEGGAPLQDDQKRGMEEVKRSADKKVSSKVPTDRLRSKVVNGLFQAPFWEEVAFACINCGTCTFLCPTCWCFDIQDELMGK